nr:pleckstrin homology domain-containing family G member 4B isoform X3 [Pongo abelii]
METRSPSGCSAASTKWQVPELRAPREQKQKPPPPALGEEPPRWARPGPGGSCAAGSRGDAPPRPDPRSLLGETPAPPLSRPDRAGPRERSQQRLPRPSAQGNQAEFGRLGASMGLSTADGGGGPGARDLESLDAYIQRTLSALYPPFEATAATVLWQLFSVAERCHGGDGLHCLTSFLLPAKRALQHLQQEACARYRGLVFLHPGWPLCAHEKVVVQLASLHGVRLQPGDFYLQVTSSGKQSARLVLKCLSRLGRGTEEVTVPEAMYGCVFTGAFLEWVNRERRHVPLKTCLLTSGLAVHRAPWSDVTDPVFVPSPGAILQSCSSCTGPERLPSSPSEAPVPTQAMAGPHFQGSTSCPDTLTPPCRQGRTGSDQLRHLPYPGRAELGSPRTLFGSSDRDFEKVSPSEQGPRMPPENCGGSGDRPDPMDQEDGPKALTFHTDLGIPSSRRRPPGDPTCVQPRRWFRESYMEALRNPMPLGSSEEALRDPACSSLAEASWDLGTGAAASGTQEETSGPRGDPQQTPSLEKERHTPSWTGPGAAGQTLPRRSRSRERAPRSSRGAQAAACHTSHHSAGSRPGGHRGGQAVGTPNCVPVEGPGCTKEEDVLASSACVSTDGGSLHCHNPSRPSGVPAQQPHPEQEGWPPGTGDFPSQVPKQVLDVSQELLQSGIVTLPGTRDRHGRAVVQIRTRSPLWTREHSSCAELTRLLLYFHSIPRKEVRDLGLVVLVDARRSPAAPAVSHALAGLQNNTSPIIHSILLLVDKESAFRPDKDAIIQCEVVSSLKALHKFVDSCQLTADLDGSFPYSHGDWICFRQRLEHFAANCEEAIIFLQNSFCSLNTHRTPRTAQEVTELIDQHETMMKLVLEDPLLVSLRLEGGTVLARLRREELGTEDSRDTLEASTGLYDRVDEEVHRLVLALNNHLQQLERLRELASLLEGNDQVHARALTGASRQRRAAGTRGTVHTPGLPTTDPSSQMLARGPTGPIPGAGPGTPHQQSYQKGLQLAKENPQRTEEMVQDFRRGLSAVVSQAECGEGELARWTHSSELCETVSSWMGPLDPEASASSLLAECLRSCHQEATSVAAEAFPGAGVAVLKPHALGRLWASQQDLWLQYPQTRLRLEEALSKAASDPSLPPLAQSPPKHERAQEAMRRPHKPPSVPSTDSEGGAWEPAQPLSSLPGRALLCGQDGEPLGPGLCAPWDPLSPLGGLPGAGATTAHLEDSSACSSEPIQTLASRPRKHPQKKMIKKTQSFEIPQPDSGPRDSCQPDHTGVFSKGLEVTSTVATEKKLLLRQRARSPPVTRSRSLSSPSGLHPAEEDGRQQVSSSRLRHIMAEMIATEREYVRCLGYVIDNYFPEMKRMDLPQGLRGKHHVIFGNLEKLHDFHQQHFLRELERCRHCPLAVGRSFLRHEEQFGMYVIYSKNKPQSDALLSSHGNAFFKVIPLGPPPTACPALSQAGADPLTRPLQDKQRELGDKMDLASYLLRPVQRVAKYALLLQDLLKEASCSLAQEQELGELRAAEVMVCFQLRHGNDLLAMDAIRGCDVNLKEQGQLRCRDEFIVCCGRKKYLRHVFLFEDLILFSKTQKVEGSHDVYLYKQSFKTAEIGMTENVGDSGLRFEIWFRRRQKSQDTYILQASSAEVKSAWTDVIGRILWRQALKSRELRIQEMASMGIGNQPFMDIKPRDRARDCAVISDRAPKCAVMSNRVPDSIVKGTESQMRGSTAVSSSDHATPFKRPHSTISDSSTSSSSSQSSSILVSLGLLVSSSPAHPGLWSPAHSPWSSDIRACVEEDEPEPELETGTQAAVHEGAPAVLLSRTRQA